MSELYLYHGIMVTSDISIVITRLPWMETGKWVETIPFSAQIILGTYHYLGTWIR